MRRRCLDSLDGRQPLVDLALPPIRPATGPSRPDASGTIWQYWDDGPESAPDVVRMAMASVDRFAWAPVVRLTEETIAAHVRLHPVVAAKRHAMTATHFSDVLRLHLLAERGGVWLDATVMLTAGRPAPIADAPFFAFTRPEDPFLLSSWYLQCRPGDPLVTAWRDLLIRYWQQHDRLEEYFLVHFLFEALVTCHRAARRQWLRTPVSSFEGPHRLQHILLQQYEAAEVSAVLAEEWLHKLTYKFAEPPDPQAASVLNHLLGRA
jgi:hypothetical protein